VVYCPGCLLSTVCDLDSGVAVLTRLLLFVGPIIEGASVRLATFIQISDLHFGDIDLNSQNKDAVLSALTSALASNTGPIWDGLLGHCHHSLVRLEQIHAKLRQQENAVLIVTGDLTAYGAETQFDTAAEFLGGLLMPPKVASPIGLRQKEWRTNSIPGNHDHWSGKPIIFGGPTPGLAKYFPVLPAIIRHQLPSGQFITFLRLDSDADVNPYWSNRFLARGCFTTQLHALASKLPIAQKMEIRVLLVHHSYTASGAALAMTPLSKAALNDFIIDHAISVLLCGHIHQPPFAVALTATHLQQSRAFMEARSGTTTQISTLPLYWRTVFQNRPLRPRHWPNSLLIHRLFLEEDGSIEWEVETRLENSLEFGFVPILPDGSSGRFRFKVWSP
jgi:predicted MPP superfamily phosphohydrolase